MTAAISNTVAEKAVCWCDGRKNRRSLVMGRRFTLIMPGLARSSINFPQSLPEAGRDDRVYRSDQTGIVPLLIMPLKISLQTPQSPTQVVVLRDGPVIAQGRGRGRCRNKLIDGHFVVHEAGELTLCTRLRTPLH